MPLTELLAPTYRQMLNVLLGLLDKVEAQRPGAEAEALLGARIAPDMYPLATQLRFAAYQAQEATFRLLGEPLPPRLDELIAEARAADDSPGTIAGARARIKEALSFLEGLEPGALNAGADRPIVLELPNGMTFDLTGHLYARDWALPQFYFHLLTAYAILRSAGVEIGKADYVPYMFAYLRPGTMPQP